MSDRIFYPLVVALAAMMVVLAMRPASANAAKCGPVSGGDSDYQTISVQGEQLCRITAGGDAAIGIVETDLGASLRIETAAGILNDNPLKGPHFQLAADLENVFAGQQVRVTMRVRPAAKRGAHTFQVNYSAGRPGESGWKTFALRPEWRDYSFTYWVPEKGTQDNAFDYLGVRPVVPEETRAIEIQSLTFYRLSGPGIGDGA